MDPAAVPGRSLPWQRISADPWDHGYIFFVAIDQVLEGTDNSTPRGDRRSRLQRSRRPPAHGDPHRRRPGLPEQRQRAFAHTMRAHSAEPGAVHSRRPARPTAPEALQWLTNPRSSGRVRPGIRSPGTRSSPPDGGTTLPCGGPADGSMACSTPSFSRERRARETDHATACNRHSRWPAVLLGNPPAADSPTP